MRPFYFLLLVLLPLAGQAQPGQSQIEFLFAVNGEPLQLEKNYFLPAVGDSVQFDKVAFYLAHVELVKGSKTMSKVTKDHLLLDADNPESLVIPLMRNPGKFDGIRFSVGVDSAIQAGGAQGDDLDPMHGMYWTWRTGYIHAKIEGTTPKCPARKNRFLYHVGGYHFPNNSIREVEVSLKKNKSHRVYIHLDRLWDQMKVSDDYRIMSPGDKAMQLADVLPNLFSAAE